MRSQAFRTEIQAGSRIRILNQGREWLDSESLSALAGDYRGNIVVHGVVGGGTTPVSTAPVQTSNISPNLSATAGIRVFVSSRTRML